MAESGGERERGETDAERGGGGGGGRERGGGERERINSILREYWIRHRVRVFPSSPHPGGAHCIDITHAHRKYYVVSLCEGLEWWS